MKISSSGLTFSQKDIGTWLPVKMIYWLGFLMYFKITLIVIYNFFFPVSPLFMTYYIIGEFLIDTITIPYRPTSSFLKFFSIVHHLFAIAFIFNEYYFVINDAKSFSYKLVHVYVFATLIDLVGYSRIIFRNNVSAIYKSAYIRTIFGIIAPFHIILTMNTNLFSYICAIFNFFVIAMIWWYTPDYVFPDPYVVSEF
ncbi:MAG: hypothetical protein Edafosvirus11_23 [Edafosvirus sp.]|uniref:Uncharacterized protein n=1 Tax=Edafosvirus sp. TaxID=2487765 RepID=A0A3G4ZU09_9VIRU|nr:MAG: hypothetical protein Edafosvirus11_23 [Edafosvirus sp.]